MSFSRARTNRDCGEYGMKCSAGKRSDRRTDHKNWKSTSSQKRGSYFGSYRLSVSNEIAEKKGGAQARNSPARPDRRRRRKSNRILERAAEGDDHQHDKEQNEMRRLGKIVVEREDTVDQLEGVRNALTDKIASRDELLKETSEKREEVKQAQAKFQNLLDLVIKENKNLEEQEKDNRCALKENKAELEKEQDRFRDLQLASDRVENRLKRELKQAKILFNSRMERLKMTLGDVQGKLCAEDAETTQTVLTETEMKHENMYETADELRRDLIKAKAWKLHKALRSTLRANKKHEQRLHGIIAHLQGQQHETNGKRDLLLAKRNVVRKDLENAEMLYENMCKTLASEDHDLVIGRVAGGDADPSESAARLRAKLATARSHSRRLADLLGSTKASRQTEKVKGLATERQRLLVYAQTLEKKLSVG